MPTSNKSIKVYQFIEASKIRLAEYVNRLFDLELIICFDLEDSIKLVDDKSTIGVKYLKTNVFDNISRLLSDFHIKDFGVRINEINTEESTEDIILLSRLVNSSVHLQIFLPKVHTPSLVKSAIECFNFYKIKNFELIPIIESQKGFINLSEILKTGKDYISKIAFGHCDFNYDCRIFPFHHQDSTEYWQWIKVLTDRLDEEIVFINSPYLHLNYDQGLNDSLKKLLFFKKNAGQITLALRQSLICNNFFKIKLSNSTENYSKRDSDILLNVYDYANKIVNDYNKYRSEGKSFAIDPIKRQLISPQEYLSAKAIVEKRDEFSS